MLGKFSLRNLFPEILTAFLILIFVVGPIHVGASTLQCTDCRAVIGEQRTANLTGISGVQLPRQEVFTSQFRNLTSPANFQNTRAESNTERHLIIWQAELEVRLATWFLYAINPVKANLPCLC